MITARVTFADSASTPSVLTEMREGVAARLSEAGRSEKANASMVARTVVMLGVTFGAYAHGAMEDEFPPVGSP